MSTIAPSIITHETGIIEENLVDQIPASKNLFDVLEPAAEKPSFIDMSPGTSFAPITFDGISEESKSCLKQEGSLSSFSAFKTSITDLASALDTPKKSASHLDLSSMMNPIVETLKPAPVNSLLQRAIDGHNTDEAVKVQEMKGKVGKAQSRRVSKRKQRAAERAAGYLSRSDAKSKQLLERRNRILKQKRRR